MRYTALLCCLLFMPLLVAEEGQAQDSLPPILREVHIPVDDDEPNRKEVEEKPEISVESLSADLSALRQAVERARKAIREKNIEGIDPEWVKQEQLGSIQEIGRRKQGDAVISKSLGKNHLEIQAYDDNSYDVTARIRNGQLVMVYSELLYLIGRSWDDHQAINRNQLVDMHIKDMPWQEALTVLLGQGGMAWKEEQEKDRRKIVIYPVRKHPRTRDDLRSMAIDAWAKASRNRDNAIAAQALCKRARQYFEAGKYTASIQTFFDVSDTFSEMAEDDPQVRHWVKQAQLGIGDTMMALEQYREARAVYLNFLSVSLETEQISSDVYMKAAQASMKYAEQESDEIALEKAEDILNSMLTKFRRDKSAHNNIVRAHYMLGSLMIKKRAYAAAKTYFNTFKQEQGSNHRLDWYLAECEYQLGVESRGKGHLKNADIYFENAMNLYRSIADDYARNQADPLIKESLDRVYENSFYRVGECYLMLQHPKFPEALVSFLRAREAFPDNDFLGAQILVKISHCYAELSADDESIAFITEMLRNSRLDDSNVRLRIDELLSDIQSGLGEYQGHIKAKALFYIAQGRYKIAQQNRFDNSKIASAIKAYERVLNNNPGRDLRDASRLGLARAAVLAKDDDYAESQLQELLRDPSVTERDRAYASQLLGRFYRERGLYRKAIEAFQGNLTE